MSQNIQKNVVLLNEEEYKKFNSEFQAWLTDRSLAYIISPKFVPMEKEAGAKVVGDMTFVKVVEVTNTPQKDATPSPFTPPVEPAV